VSFRHVVLIFFKDVSYNCSKQRKIYGLVSLAFHCVKDVQGMVFSYLEQEAEGGNKRLLYISRYFSVYLNLYGVHYYSEITSITVERISSSLSCNFKF
jgi:hypothetical protein